MRNHTALKWIKPLGFLKNIFSTLVEQMLMLDLIKVDVYGQKMPINQLATLQHLRLGD